MKRTTLLLATMMIAAAPVQADEIDDTLNNRATVVAAVAILMQTPPNCNIDHKRPDPYDVARFIVRHGHNPNDSFMTDVKVQMKKNEGYGMKENELKIFCGLGIIYSAKVRDANK